MESHLYRLQPLASTDWRISTLFCLKQQ